MKKAFLYSAIMVALFASCSNDIALNSGTQSAETVDNAIGFQFINRNSITSRANSTLLNNAGHYNFGVFAYKLSENSSVEVMNNYLVGYYDETGKKGYSLSSTDQTTLESSKWAYEKLGNKEYSYTGNDGYYQSSNDGTGFYESNNANQYLKYWDKSTTQTDFFAYAPYLNGKNEEGTQNTAKVNTANDKTTISFPMTDGYDDASKYDFIAAHKKVVKNDYDKEVQIDFKRLSAKIKIGFYEDIAGYKVKILNLKDEAGDNVGVSAAPAKKTDTNGTTYSYGTLYYKGTGTGTYPASGTTTTDDNVEVSVTGAADGKYSNESGSEHSYINFVIPKGADGSGFISETQGSPSMSETEYYLIPDNGTNQTGLTFHVTYQLTADDTNETIKVYNATVYVPYQKDNNNQYCAWKSNYVYTYIFKITKGSSGSTDKPDIDPADPKADDKNALNPIIFDGCTVENFEETKSEHNIN